MLSPLYRYRWLLLLSYGVIAGSIPTLVRILARILFLVPSPWIETLPLFVPFPLAGFIAAMTIRSRATGWIPGVVGGIIAIIGSEILGPGQSSLFDLLGPFILYDTICGLLSLLGVGLAIWLIAWFISIRELLYKMIKHF